MVRVSGQMAVPDSVRIVCVSYGKFLFWTDSHALPDISAPNSAIGITQQPLDLEMTVKPDPAQVGQAKQPHPHQMLRVCERSDETHEKHEI